ncbi:MerR family DNA-binding transcriptional regulator [Pacificimonas sp. WHA3]|uniref:MerR family DNA-binding transcriptional regulator n=1 Tax=Pacificimonas pallii TaxID=2827236 RepID=A0ABS6SEJ3_9SPHN|nr:MerR family DNA-binding transcriptional regulator [Pacificimonas pallii]MBV7256822.1 MerR family DNA-binding transcriptional regulator [Pacificimonas pallii]
MPRTALTADLEPAGQESFTIAELSREYDVTARTIRYYEAEGLLAPKRAGQNRIYSKRDRARLGWILRGKRVGFSLAEIRDLLDIYKSGGPAKQRSALVEKCRERVAALESQRTDIDETITDLQSFIGAVQDMPDAPRQGTHSNA